MQALYQWDFDQSANIPEHVIQQFRDMQNMEKVDVEYFESLFNHAVENIAAIDTEISLHLDRPLDQLDPIERSILRICCTELKTQPGTPYKVVVNEALEISKDFGADKGYRYINGIADKLAASLRSIEYNDDHPNGNPLSEHASVKEPQQKVPANTVKISMKEKPDTASGIAAGSKQSTDGKQRGDFQTAESSSGAVKSQVSKSTRTEKTDTKTQDAKVRDGKAGNDQPGVFTPVEGKTEKSIAEEIKPEKSNPLSGKPEGSNSEENSLETRNPRGGKPYSK